jgi:hypothetical protein
VSGLSAVYGYRALVRSCYLSSFVCSAASEISTAQSRDGSVFFNLTKYPPDLSFLLMTTGIDLLLLQSWMWFENRNPSGGQTMAVFGWSSLFFYITHLYLYALMGWSFPLGMGLVQMILVWIAGLLILYPLCLRYGRFKQSRPTDSLWRLL